jgi:hypothetical protein
MATECNQRVVLITTVLVLFAVFSGTAAGVAIAATDSDGNGINDSVETDGGNSVDTDGDGIADYLDGAQGGGY